MSSDLLIEPGLEELLKPESVSRGKVRVTYWLTSSQSTQLCESLGLSEPTLRRGIMVTTDKLTAFDVRWLGESDAGGVPHKGAALNHVSQYFLESLGINHHLDMAVHPNAWIVKRYEPIRVEWIVRRYITGSLWRAYEQGAREHAGVSLPEGLAKNTALPSPILTPTTKTQIQDLPGVDASQDAPLSLSQIEQHLGRFGVYQAQHVQRVAEASLSVFDTISKLSSHAGFFLADTKFEWAWDRDAASPILIDEVGTPDSSRYWPKDDYAEGRVVDVCKEFVRSHLLEQPFAKTLISGALPERETAAKNYRLPLDVLQETSQRYLHVAQRLTGSPVNREDQPSESLLDAIQSLFPSGVSK